MSVKTESKLYIKLRSSDLFAQLMTLNEYTNDSLTDAVNDKLRKSGSRHRVKNRSLIGHLRRGYRDTVHPEVATVIAGLFKVPLAALFQSAVSNVHREVA